eukprot:CAMPEP_0196738454 /NCGR_PEP_ID=MMETSP1091-20130531/15819_1 /TAXON_ID=302021 /ORGANISM="Rhodomonas sp., Strain CCMP768" /LENGTH=119 /DNA_ID=CAMNT_0042082423 /DNA_START=229 /DNA_END=584 /DNA_ORIENTATION=+
MICASRLPCEAACLKALSPGKECSTREKRERPGGEKVTLFHNKAFESTATLIVLLHFRKDASSVTESNSKRRRFIASSLDRMDLRVDDEMPRNGVCRAGLVTNAAIVSVVGEKEHRRRK